MRRRQSSHPSPPPASSGFTITSWSLMAHWIAPRSTPLSWLYSKPGARRTPAGCPCSRIGPT
eukprot:8907250-Alexandrium_andersonii.AAC.1